MAFDVNYTPRTWVPGEVVTAAEMNAEIKTALTGVQSAWNTYTATWTGTTTSPVIGNGSLTGRYARLGKTLDFFIQVTMGSTTTFGSGTWLFALPQSPLFQNITFTGSALDASAGTIFPLAATTNGSGQIVVRGLPAVAGAAYANGGPTVPMTWAVSDVLTLVGRYESP